MPGTTSPAVVPYDFRRPNKINRDHIRALEIVGEAFARQFTTILSTIVRSVSPVTLEGIHQRTYYEYLNSIPNPTYLAVLSISPLPGTAFLQIPLTLVMSAIDRMLGGPGTGTMPIRALTEIEAGLMRRVMDRTLAELATSFESLVAINPTLLQQESNPQFAQIASGSDLVVTIGLEMRIGTRTNKATLCLPFSALEPVLDRVTDLPLGSRRSDRDPAAVSGALAHSLGDALVDMTVRFDPVTLSSSDIVGVQPGDVIPLHHPVDAPLTVTVGDIPCFSAVPGRRGRRLACLIVDPTSEVPAP